MNPVRKVSLVGGFKPPTATRINTSDFVKGFFLTGFTPTPNFGVSLYGKRGFTLIELLVVISIIGFLATASMVVLNSVRMKARDAKRNADIKQIQKALDLYYDQNSTYPVSGGCNATIPNGGWCNSIESLSGGHWIRNGAANMGEFLKQDPLDPKPVASANWYPNSGGTYYYYANSYGGSGQWYMIIYGLEDKSSSMQSLDGVRACDGTYFHYGSGSDGIMTVGGNCATK